MKAFSWWVSWLAAGVSTMIATALLLLPALLVIVPLYWWLSVRIGLPVLTWYEVAGAVYVWRLAQCSATINVPANSSPPAQGVKE